MEHTYYKSQNGTITCSDCHIDKICFECGDIVHSWITYGQNYILCKDCDHSLNISEISLNDAQQCISYDDLDEGKELFEEADKPFLIDQSNSDTIRSISELISEKSFSTEDYIRNCYNFCRLEIKYSENTFLSPIETIYEGRGNCSSKSGLLANLLACDGFKVKISTTETHAWVILKYRIPKFQQFKAQRQSDGSCASEWIGLDPVSNYPFKLMPKTNYDVKTIDHDF